MDSMKNLHISYTEMNKKMYNRMKINDSFSPLILILLNITIGSEGSIYMGPINLMVIIKSGRMYNTYL